MLLGNQTKPCQSGQNIRLVFHKQAAQKMFEIGQKNLD